MPAVTTLMGRGALPDEHPLCLGMPGMHGNYTAVTSMQRADLLVALGPRFDDRVTGKLAAFAPGAKVIHADIDPAEIGKNRPVDVPIVGDAKSVIHDLCEAVEEIIAERGTPDYAAWTATLNGWKAKYPYKYNQPADGLLKPEYVIEQIGKATGGDAIFVGGVGQHQMWASQHIRFKRPNTWINSGGLGTMGFGLPAAMGVQLANPGATVACVTGESSIQMCLQELSTCKQYRLPIKIVNLNNKYMGMVRQWQQFFHGNRYSESYMDALPDFVKLAEGYGHHGMLIDKPADVEPALREAFKRKNDLIFLDFITDQAENVYPMVPGGKGITEMILSEDL